MTNILYTRPTLQRRVNHPLARDHHPPDPWYLMRNGHRSPRTREEWLERMIGLLRSPFISAGFPLPLKVRATCGFPSKSALAQRKRRIGECWADDASAGRIFEVLISPLEANPLRVTSILVHELCHAAVGLKCGHRGAFPRCAKAVGLAGKMTETTAGNTLRRRLHGLARFLGIYPHHRLTHSNAPPKQGTRMLKVECQVCGCVVRMTRKWLEEVGPPTCGCGGAMLPPMPTFKGKQLKRAKPLEDQYPTT